MKKSVVDIYDLQEMAPFFKGRVGTWLGKLLIKCLRVDLVNKVHARNCHLRGAEFTSALLHDPIIDLSYEVHNKEILDHLPEGAFVTVSNHPIGSLDGIMLIDIFASRRPDFKVMVNGILTKIGAMEDNFISVVPDSHKPRGESGECQWRSTIPATLERRSSDGFLPCWSDLIL